MHSAEVQRRRDRHGQANAGGGTAPEGSARASTTESKRRYAAAWTNAAISGCDCSASAEVAKHYAHWLSEGIHIVTPNKKANSAPYADYQRVKDAAWRPRGSHIIGFSLLEVPAYA